MNIQIVNNISSQYKWHTVDCRCSRDYRHRFFISEGSFGNCQSFTINNFREFVNIVKEKQEILHLFKAIKNAVDSRKLLICDLDKNNTETFENYLKELEIRFDKLPYVSSNKSEMCIFIVNIHEALEKNNM